MRRGGMGLAGLVLGVTVAGCAPITSRQARLWEAGCQIETDAAEQALADTLARDVETLPAPQAVVVAAALALLGTPDSALDCSALVARAWSAAGVALPRTVREQLRAGAEVPAGALEPGDLVFFAFSRRPADHVALYAGRGRIVHVSSAAGCVQLAPLDSAPFATARVAVRRPGAPAASSPGV